MDDQAHPNHESTNSATWHPESASHASGMFSHSRRFTVTGGTFTNITNNHYPSTPSLPSGTFPSDILLKSVDIL
ncbi:hypothetical protein B0H12DRAFT_1147914 [Mycena haematopus]|nr:hypothetical protein B0H12DRAFT_1147914 [Mycena haematopus]